MIEEQLQEVYDWEIMHLMDGLEQEQSYELEGIAALEQLPLEQDRMKPPYQCPSFQVLQGNTEQLQGPASESSVDTQVDQIVNDTTPRSLSSISCPTEQIHQIYGMDHSSEATQSQRYQGNSDAQ